LGVTLVIYQESLHDARSTKCKFPADVGFVCDKTRIAAAVHKEMTRRLCVLRFLKYLFSSEYFIFPSCLKNSKY